MILQNSLPVDYVSHHTSSNFTAVDALSLPERRELLALLKTSYPDWGMENIYDDYPCTRHLHVFRLWEGSTLIASRQVFIANTVNPIPEWSREMACAMGIKYFAIGSRAIVHPDYRNQGLGRYLVQAVNNEAYAKYGVNFVYGSSTSLAAISLYLRLGAQIWHHDLEEKQSYGSELFGKSGNVQYPRLNKPIRYVYQRETSNNS